MDTSRALGHHDHFRRVVAEGRTHGTDEMDQALRTPRLRIRCSRQVAGERRSFADGALDVMSPCMAGARSRLRASPSPTPLDVASAVDPPCTKVWKMICCFSFVHSVLHPFAPGARACAGTQDDFRERLGGRNQSVVVVTLNFE